MREYQSFSAFWPYYLREHNHPMTRAFHYAGTSFAICLFIYAIAVQAWIVLLGALICGYFFAWISHAFIEKNRPATFTYPLWSLMSDFKMLFCFVTGQMPKELERANAQQG